MNLRASSSQAGSLHFDTIDLSARAGNSQTVSFALHAAILAVLLFLATNPGTHKLMEKISLGPSGRVTAYVPPTDPKQIGRPSMGPNSGGGHHELMPATAGRLAPPSSAPILPPQKIINEAPALPEPTAVFDPNASAIVPLVPDLGLPWMREKNGSAGTGGPHGFGSGKGNGMGDGDGDGAGVANDGAPYANVVAKVACLYCPEPPYTEEARKSKLQGQMVLQVLVGEDGKAKQVRILRSLGMGLDESAERTVYSWRFSPARDANRHAVASWVTIETRFQLF